MVVQFLAAGISVLEARTIDYCQGSPFAGRILNSRRVSGGGHIAPQSPGFLYVLLANGLSECARSRVQTWVNMDKAAAEQRERQKRRKTDARRTDASAHDDGRGPISRNIPQIEIGSLPGRPDPDLDPDLPHGFVPGSLWDQLVIEGIRERQMAR